jgi:hypothetical protein
MMSSDALPEAVVKRKAVVYEATISGRRPGVLHRALTAGFVVGKLKVHAIEMVSATNVISALTIAGRECAPCRTKPRLPRANSPASR